MITTIVQFRLPEPQTLEDAAAVFRSTAPKYRDMRGLIRKVYLRSEDGDMVGGVYLWQSRADAERVYTPEWEAFVEARYGTRPTISYFDSPVIVDNLSGEILTE